MRTGTMEVSVYTYPMEGVEPPPAWEDLVEVEPAGGMQDAKAAESAGAQSVERVDTEQLRRSFDSGFAMGREAGQREGRAAAEAEYAGQRAAAERERARQMAGLIERFREEREHYLQTVEHEVVELALAIAARILRREAQMDPLLLTGAARVALGQLSESAEVKLHVPEGDLELWREAIAHLPNLAVRPEVVAGQQMRLGDCVLETKLGSVDLGVRAQLGEIERGFFDRAERAGAERANPSRDADAGPREAALAGMAR